MASFTPSTDPAAPLPTPRLQTLRPGLSLLPPLSRRGTGPGLVVVCPDTEDSLAIVDGVPWLLVKWAEEGYAVVQVQPRAIRDADGAAEAALRAAYEALVACEECTHESGVGIVVYRRDLWDSIAPALAAQPQIVAAVVYASASEADALATSPVPVLQHLSGPGPVPGRTVQRVSDQLQRHWYPSMPDDAALSSSSSSTSPASPSPPTSGFAVPFQPGFHYATEAVSHTRSLSFLKPRLHGPYFDLELLWDEHTYYEFADRSVAHTMSTMVQEPYVNHVPTLTGGIGRASLTAFYRDHFIFSNAPDTVLELVSRTVGIDRVVDEFVFRFTHDRVIDWMLPGVPPTGRTVEVPFTAVVNVRGDRLYHEHIAWDQASVLAQLGLLPDHLPFPYAVEGWAADTPLEYRLPVAGVESAAKMREKNAVASNAMFAYKVREVEKKEVDSRPAGKR